MDPDDGSGRWDRGRWRGAMNERQTNGPWAQGEVGGTSATTLPPPHRTPPTHLNAPPAHLQQLHPKLHKVRTADCHLLEGTPLPRSFPNPHPSLLARLGCMKLVEQLDRIHSDEPRRGCLRHTGSDQPGDPIRRHPAALLCTQMRCCANTAVVLHTHSCGAVQTQLRCYANS